MPVLQQALARASLSSARRMGPEIPGALRTATPCLWKPQNKSWLSPDLGLTFPLEIAMSTPVLKRRRILVVDDEPLVCDALKMMLEFDGHQVLSANSAREALALFEPGKFDVIITDFEMPQMKGDEFAAKIKQADPQQPVVMITAYAELLESSKQPLTGVDFMISKPFLLENLRAALVKVTSSAAPPKPAT
jgi:CheY-like chemotaxis protein